jgi:AcrR family transcriptional regulator
MMASVSGVSIADVVRRPGRPRDTRVEQAVLDATVDLVSEVGFGGLTVEAVAARAGVGKATIYRRWPSKEALLIASMTCLANNLEPPDTGSLRTDIIQSFAALAEHMNTSDAGRMLPQLVAEACSNPEMGELYRHFVDERRQMARTLLKRAKARGELRDGVDVELLIDMVSGVIFYRRLVSGAVIDPAAGVVVADMICEGVEVQPG